MNKGYIKLNRKILEWEWYDDINTTRLFIHLLLKANFQNKKWKGIVVKRGQLVTSLDSLVKETSLTKQQVRRCLKLLKATREIRIEPTSQYQVITIVSYNNYQEQNMPTTHEEHTDNTPTTHEEHTDNTQATPTKEGKEGIKEKTNPRVSKKENKENPENLKGTRFSPEKNKLGKPIISKEFENFALEEGLTPTEADYYFQMFADHYKAQTGKKALSADWLATWRNWIRRERLYSRNNANNATEEAIKDISAIVEECSFSDVRPESNYTEA